MDYENTPISSNIEDRRGQRGGGGMVGGGGLGIGAIIIVFAISYFTGINPAVLMGGAEIVSKGMNPQQQTQPASTGPAADPNDPDAKIPRPCDGRDRGRLDDRAAAADRRQIRARDAGDL